MKSLIVLIAVSVAVLTGCARSSSPSAAKTRLVYPDGLVLTGTNRLVTPTCYQPPVDIRWVVSSKASSSSSMPSSVMRTSSPTLV